MVCYLLASKSLLSPGLKAILDNLIPALRPFREFQLDPVLFILGSNSKLFHYGVSLTKMSQMNRSVTKLSVHFWISPILHK